MAKTAVPRERPSTLAEVWMEHWHGPVSVGMGVVLAFVSGGPP
jgi:hypothetical protein